MSHFHICLIAERSIILHINSEWMIFKGGSYQRYIDLFFLFFSCSDHNDDRQTLSASCYLLINSDERQHRTFCLFPHWHFNWDRQFSWAETRKTLPKCVQGQKFFLATSQIILLGVQFYAKSFFLVFKWRMYWDCCK